jgi:hypothetical protein
MVEAEVMLLDLVIVMVVPNHATNCLLERSQGAERSMRVSCE